jgi:beta-lactamase class A
MPASGSLEETLGSLDELPGSVSYLIRKNGETIAARNPDTALAVGSTFKLAVLRALRDRIENGGLSWDHTVSLKKEWRSLPTGILQDWPSGSSVTLQTLATLMISVSDNTAADALIDILAQDHRVFRTGLPAAAQHPRVLSPEKAGEQSPPAALSRGEGGRAAADPEPCRGGASSCRALHR